MGKNRNKQHRPKIYKKNNYTCCHCGLYFKHSPDYDGVIALHNGEIYLEIDHIIPLSKGGRDILKNKQSLCQRCNNKKSNKI